MGSCTGLVQRFILCPGNRSKAYASGKPCPYDYSFKDISSQNPSHISGISCPSPNHRGQNPHTPQSRSRYPTDLRHSPLTQVCVLRHKAPARSLPDKPAAVPTASLSVRGQAYHKTHLEPRSMPEIESRSACLEGKFSPRAQGH
jgi:hypothetical protein